MTDTNDLIKDLSSDNDETRHDAITMLGELRAVSALQEILMFINHENLDTRYAVALALANLQSPESVEAISKALTVERNIVVLRRLCQALGKIGTGDSIACLTKNLSHSIPEVRGTSAHILGQVGDLSHIPRLENLYSDTTKTSWGSVEAAAKSAVEILRFRFLLHN